MAHLSEAILFIVFCFLLQFFFLQGKDGESLKQIMKITIHGNLRGPPNATPLHEIRPY